MDVRCTKCGVEYEFDDEKVKPSGVTVKCTSCGHVFKVKAETHDTQPPVDAQTAAVESWMVRHADGTVMRFKELTTLQKWIVEQRVGRDDEISRTGRSWKRLGEIAELSSFFQVVDAANAARQQAAGTPMAPVPSPAPSSSAPPASLTTPTLPTPSAMPAPSLAASSPSASSPSASSPSAPPRPADGGFFGVDAAIDDLDDLDEEDPVRAWKRRGRVKRAALAVVVTAAVGTGGLYLFARPTFDRLFGPLVSLAKPDAPDPLDARLGEIARVLESDDEATLERGVSELSALATDDEPRALALLSRFHAARARIAKAQGKSQDEPLAKAYELASRARAKAPDAPEADLAFAAYQAARGALVEMETDLESARAHARGRPDAAEIERQADAIAKAAQASSPTPAAPDAGVGADANAKADAKDVDAKNGDAKDGDEDAKRADAPASYDDLVRRADRLRARGRTQSAISLYHRALEQRPSSARALSGAGWCYIDLERFSRAASSFRKAIDADAGHAVAYFGLAESLRFAGDKAGAVRAYQRYLELEPSGPDAAVARNALEALK